MEILCSEQINGLANLLIDIGKLFIGSVVIGFFIPSLGISLAFFVVGIIFAVGSFYIGLSLLRFVKVK